MSSGLLIKDLEVRYLPHDGGQPKPVLKELRLELQYGKIGVLFGENGSGKTTILNTIAGLVKPDKGSILLDGKQLKAGDVGYLFQDYRSTFFPWKTARSNLQIPLDIHRINKKDKSLRISNMERNIDIRWDSYPYQLSGGEQQLLALFRALVLMPKLLLLDEPFSALDVSRHDSTRQKFLEIIEESRTTTLVVTHDVMDAVLLGDQVFVVKDGMIKRECKVDLPRPRQVKFLNTTIAKEIEQQLCSWARK